MKNNIIIIAMLSVLTLTANAQTKRVPISKKDVGPFRPALYQQIIDTDNNDTTRAIFLLFQNAKYTSIIDTKSIVFMNPDKDSSEVFAFLKDLNSAMTELANKSEMSWERTGYKIRTYGGSMKYFYIGESDGIGYTWLYPKQVVALQEWFSSIGFRVPKAK